MRNDVDFTLALPHWLTLPTAMAELSATGRSPDTNNHGILLFTSPGKPNHHPRCGRYGANFYDYAIVNSTQPDSTTHSDHGYEDTSHKFGTLLSTPLPPSSTYGSACASGSTNDRDEAKSNFDIYVHTPPTLSLSDASLSPEISRQATSSSTAT